MLDPVRAPGVVQRHPELRWLLAVALVAAVVATAATSLSGVFRDDSSLAVTSPDQLIEQVRAPHVGGYSGTIVAQVDLGLPRAINSVLTSAAPAGELLDGSHQIRYWYGGSDRERVAVVSRTSEQDLFRNGNDLWQWDTSTRVAQRGTVDTSADAALPLRLSSSADLTPPHLAKQILDVIGDNSDTTLRSGESATDRPTYELVIDPDSASSRIGEIHIEVDGTQGVPLGVQIFPLNDDVHPALDVSFQTISFAEPASQNFSFTPPAGAKIGSSPRASTALDQISLLGTGWSCVAVYRSTAADGAQLAEVAQGLLGDRARRVKGAWGKGRLLQTPILSVLVTDNGRIVAGAVSAALLYRAVG
jgi:hypothetical protein